MPRYEALRFLGVHTSAPQESEAETFSLTTKSFNTPKNPKMSIIISKYDEIYSIEIIPTSLLFASYITWCHICLAFWNAAFVYIPLCCLMLPFLLGSLHESQFQSFTHTDGEERKRCSWQILLKKPRSATTVSCIHVLLFHRLQALTWTCNVQFADWKC